MSPKKLICLRFVCFALLWIRVALRFTLMMTSQFPRPGDGSSAHTLWTPDHSLSIPWIPYKYLYSIHFAKWSPNFTNGSVGIVGWCLSIALQNIPHTVDLSIHILGNRDPSLFISRSPEKMQSSISLLYAVLVGVYQKVLWWVVNRRGLVIGILFEPSTDGPLSAGPRVKWSIRRQPLLWQGAGFCQVTSLFGWSTLVWVFMYYILFTLLCF